MAYSTYTPVTGVIQNITPLTPSCCDQLLTLATNGGIVTFTVSKDTYIPNNLQLRRGMRASAFYDADLPVPLIFPPRYQAEAVAVLARNETAVLQYFDENLLAADGSLKLTPGPTTTITSANGQRFTCSPGKNLLLVFYSITTRSLPPQTTPHRFLVFC